LFLVSGIATISAPLTGGWESCSGDKSLDGQKTYQGDPDLCTTCSVANAGSGQQPWWQLDLQRKYLISTIIVTGRKGIH